MSPAAAAATTLRLGPWERYFLLRRSDAAFGTSQLLVLDRPLHPELVVRVLAAVRPAFPVHFSTLDATGDELVARLDLERSASEFLTLHERWDGDAGSFMGRVLARPPDPIQHGFVQVHLVGGPTPMLGLQSFHASGDGWTAVALWQRLLGGYERLLRGEALEPAPSLAREPYSPAIAELRRRIPTSSVPHADYVGLRHVKEVRLRPEREPAAGEEGFEARVVNVTLTAEASRAFFRRAVELKAGTLALLAACLALASHAVEPSWREQDGDYFAINVPRDLRAALDAKGRAGNLAYPVGVPVPPGCLGSLEAAAGELARRIETAKGNFLFYRHAARLLEDEAAIPVVPGQQSVLPRDGRGAYLAPLATFGVTETLGRTHAGSVRVLDYLFQSPAICRRALGDRMQIGFSLRWHPLLASKLEAFVRVFLGGVVYGDPARGDEVDWRLL